MNLKRQIETITSRIIEGINLNLNDINRYQNFKINVSGIPGKYYLDRISGSYEDSLHNLIHKLMWHEKIYHEIISNKDELKKIEEIVLNFPDEIYAPDYDNAISEEEITFYEELDDQINQIQFESIMQIKRYLSKFSHFDAEEFTYHGYADDP